MSLLARGICRLFRKERVVVVRRSGRGGDVMSGRRGREENVLAVLLRDAQSFRTPAMMIARVAASRARPAPADAHRRARRSRSHSNR